MSLDTIIRRCQQVGLNAIAITDHNTIAGALKMERTAPFYVIVGEEILTLSGEVIGLFLNEEIPPFLSAKETMVRIKAQGGLVCIPHPFDRLRPHFAIHHDLEELLPYIDIIEVFNSRSILKRHNAKACQLARSYGLLSSAGSDAHTPGEIGNAYVEMPDFEDVDEFKTALAQGKIFGRRANPLVHIHSAIDRLANQFSESKHV
jgi:hypothetical protein